MSYFSQYTQASAWQSLLPAKLIKYLIIGITGLMAIIEFNAAVFMAFVFFSLLVYAFIGKSKAMDTYSVDKVHFQSKTKYLDGGAFHKSVEENDIQVANFVRDGGSYKKH